MNQAPNEFATGFLRAAGCCTFAALLVVGLVVGPRCWNVLQDVVEGYQPTPPRDPLEEFKRLEYERSKAPAPDVEPIPEPKARAPVRKPGRPPIVISPKTPADKEKTDP